MSGYHPEAYWSRVAEAIEGRGESNFLAGDDTPFTVYQRSRFLDCFLAAVPVEGRTVLEVGCGPGGNLLAMAERQPYRLIGADISAPMIDLARANTGQVGVEAELHHVDGASLPFEDGEIDVTLTVTVLMHNVEVGMLKPILREICRVTNGGVHLIEHTGNSQRVAHAILRPVELYEGLCRESGYELVSVNYLNYLFSYCACSALERLLQPTEHKEGEPYPPVLSTLQRAALPVTKLFDPLIRLKRGLTHMTFRPISQ
jgi:SAM-dependent methyltransferase